MNRVEFDVTKSVDYQSLMGRAPIAPSDAFMRRVEGRSVVVTGVGGRVGTELCNQLHSFRPRKLVMLDHSEYPLHSLQYRLQGRGVDTIPILGDYGNPMLVKRMLEKHAPDIVFHAACYSVASLVETNILWSLSNNVLSAQRFLRQCEAVNIRQVVIVSSLAAVRPTTVMGASYRLVEFLGRTSYIQRCHVVRLGNVLGGTGLLSYYHDRLTQSLPMTLPDPEEAYSFLSSGEASDLVMQALLCPPDVYSADPGVSIRLEVLGRRLGAILRLPVAFQPGVLPDLISLLRVEDSHQATIPTSNPRIRLCEEGTPTRLRLHLSLSEMQSLIYEDRETEVKTLLSMLVPGYPPPKRNPLGPPDVL